MVGWEQVNEAKLLREGGGGGGGGDGDNIQESLLIMRSQVGLVSLTSRYTQKLKSV